MIRCVLIAVLCTVTIISNIHAEFPSSDEVIAQIQSNRDNEKVLSDLLPIVRGSFMPCKYEQILITQLRDNRTSIEKFRIASEKAGALLVNKVIECLPVQTIEIESPVTKCQGVFLASDVELVSIMRSGDALLDTFIKHFPDANISKFLIQRDEKTAKAQFIYMKASPSLTSGNPVIITEPMIATGGSLEVALSMLKEKGVKEENIIIASVCVAPEGLVKLSQKFPNIKVVMIAFDEHLNEKKYIVPGVGDFGDRFFGTL